MSQARTRNFFGRFNIMNTSPPNQKRLKYLFQLVMNNYVVAVAVLLAAILLLKATQLGPAEILTWLHGDAVRQAHLFLPTFLSIGLLLGALYLMHQHHYRSVYLLDYACFRHTSDCRVSKASLIEKIHLMPSLDERSIHFLTRMFEHSGIGDQTYLPSGAHYIPPCLTLGGGRNEAEQVIFSSIDDLFAKTCISPDAIDMLITNCSGFSPVPSLADMIVNKYRLRGDIKSIHMSGMGCSAGLISVEVANKLLKLAPRISHALVVSTEIVSLHFYSGRNCSMLLPNILFRMGGAAALFSTSRSSKSRFKLMHTVRTITAAQDESYQCAFQEEDDMGEIGVNLSRNLVAVAGDTLQANIRAIGSLVLSGESRPRIHLGRTRALKFSLRTTT